MYCYILETLLNLIREHTLNTVNALKLRTFFFLFANKMSVSMAGIHKMLVRIANRENPDLSSLIWVCTVCLSFWAFISDSVFEILEHIPYLGLNEIYGWFLFPYLP